MCGYCVTLMYEWNSDREPGEIPASISDWLSLSTSQLKDLSRQTLKATKFVVHRETWECLLGEARLRLIRMMHASFEALDDAIDALAGKMGSAFLKLLILRLVASPKGVTDSPVVSKADDLELRTRTPGGRSDLYIALC